MCRAVSAGEKVDPRTFQMSQHYAFDTKEKRIKQNSQFVILRSGSHNSGHKTAVEKFLPQFAYFAIVSVLKFAIHSKLYE